MILVPINTTISSLHLFETFDSFCPSQKCIFIFWRFFNVVLKETKMEELQKITWFFQFLVETIFPGNLKREFRFFSLQIFNKICIAYTLAQISRAKFVFYFSNDQIWVYHVKLDWKWTADISIQFNCLW